MDYIEYKIESKKRYLPGAGPYLSYDIIAFDSKTPIAFIPDVSTDESLVLKMVHSFNRNQLSPIHLFDVVLDMLE